MKGKVSMIATETGVECEVRLEGVNLMHKGHLLHCLLDSIEVDAEEWEVLSGMISAGFFERGERTQKPSRKGFETGVKNAASLLAAMLSMDMETGDKNAD